MLSINPAHRKAGKNKTTKSFLYYFPLFKDDFFKVIKQSYPKDDLSSHGLAAVFLSDQRKYPHEPPTENPKPDQ